MFCPFAYRHPGVSVFRRRLPPYFAIVARMTAKLKMNPVKAVNLDRSERSGHMLLPPGFQTDRPFS